MSELENVPRPQIESVPPLERKHYSDEDLRDEQNISEILASHDTDAMKRLSQMHGISAEQLELFSQYRQQRRSVIDEMNIASARRELHNPSKTPMEEKLGIYVESLEPQVKEAVLTIAAKGYTTYESGYLMGAEQTIGFKQEYFADPHLLDVLAEQLKQQGVTVTVTPDHINLSFDRLLSTEEIKTIWNQIAAALPEASQ